LLNEQESNTATLMEIYSGKITSAKIKQLTSELNEVPTENNSQDQSSCLAGENMCNQEPDI